MIQLGLACKHILRATEELVLVGVDTAKLTDHCKCVHVKGGYPVQMGLQLLFPTTGLELLSKTWRSILGAVGARSTQDRVHKAMQPPQVDLTVPLLKKAIAATYLVSMLLVNLEH